MNDIGNKRFLALLDEEAATHRAKAAGYAGSDEPDTWTNFREAKAWGLSPLEGCLVRMGDKYRRIQNLRRNPNNDQVGESIRDTLMDLANYAHIAVCLLEEEQEAGAMHGMVMATKFADAAALEEERSSILIIDGKPYTLRLGATIAGEGSLLVVKEEGMGGNG